MICPHHNFASEVGVTCYTDCHYFMADIKIRCADCGLPFQFLGLPTTMIRGRDKDGATVMIDGCEASIAIAPMGEVVEKDERTVRKDPLPTFYLTPDEEEALRKEQIRQIQRKS